MFLQLQGQADEVVQSVRAGEGVPEGLSDAERELLRFVRLVTESAYKTTDADVARLRAVGYTDPQIAEAVYITALFAFFNRVADAFGLEDPHYERMAKPIQPAGSAWQNPPCDGGDTRKE